MDLVEDALDVGLGQDQEVWGFDAETRGAEFGLARGFFAGHIEHPVQRVFRLCKLMCDLKEQG